MLSSTPPAHSQVPIRIHMMHTWEVLLDIFYPNSTSAIIESIVNMAAVTFTGNIVNGNRRINLGGIAGWIETSSFKKICTVKLC